MNTDTGEIRELPIGEKPMPNEVYLSMVEADYLNAVEASKRPKEYSELHSHNHTKRRRALRRMQNASRRKNRK